MKEISDTINISHHYVMKSSLQRDIAAGDSNTTTQPHGTSIQQGFMDWDGSTHIQTSNLQQCRRGTILEMYHQSNKCPYFPGWNKIWCTGLPQWRN